jgi:hypothetical protein
MEKTQKNITTNYQQPRRKFQKYDPFDDNALVRQSNGIEFLKGIFLMLFDIFFKNKNNLKT